MWKKSRNYDLKFRISDKKNIWKSFTRPWESKMTSILSRCELFEISITTLSQNNRYTYCLWKCTASDNISLVTINQSEIYRNLLLIINWISAQLSVPWYVVLDFVHFERQITTLDLRNNMTTRRLNFATRRLLGWTD